jgi:hypothetical protein
MEFHDGTEPVYPDAKRGDSVAGRVTETKEQQDAHLVWWPCSFCGRKVLVAVYERHYERCACGARRCYHTDKAKDIYEEGWRKDGQERWFC